MQQSVSVDMLVWTRSERAWSSFIEGMYLDTWRLVSLSKFRIAFVWQWNDLNSKQNEYKQSVLENEIKTKTWTDIKAALNVLSATDQSTCFPLHVTRNAIILNRALFQSNKPSWIPRVQDRYFSCLHNYGYGSVVFPYCTVNWEIALKDVAISRNYSCFDSRKEL